MFADASAPVAIIQGEMEADTLSRQSALYRPPHTNGLALREAAMAIRCDPNGTADQAMRELDRYRTKLRIDVAAIGATEAVAFLDAHAQDGEGTGNPARRKMGDRFAYACAKVAGARVLYMADDFRRIDAA